MQQTDFFMENTKTTGTSKKIEYGEKVKRSYILDSLHVNQNTSNVFLFYFWWLELTYNESQKSISQNIWIFTFEFQ